MGRLRDCSGGVWPAAGRRFLLSRHAVWLTHGSLLLLTAVLWWLLVVAPFGLLLLPGVLLTHRIGVLLHEYLHGIPLRRYRYNLAVYGLFDGLMLMFGLLELFRGTHLTHHRWLNSADDTAVQSARALTGSNRLLRWLTANEAAQHLLFLWEALRGRQPAVRLGRVAAAAALSTAWAACLLALGRGDIVWKLVALNFLTVLVPASLRGAIEHHGPPGTAGFANEYFVWIPLFNLNRHVHHHLDMRCPWYLLEYRTPRPLARHCYVTYWYHAYVRRDYALLRPMTAADLACEPR